MGKTFWLRVVMMCVTLVGVIWAMRALQPRHTDSTTLSWLGFSSDKIVNLCPTRIVGLQSTTNGNAVLNQEMKWYRHSDQTNSSVELDPVAVEKWFSSNCMLKVQKVSPPDDATEIMKVFFVDGKTESLKRSPSGAFTYMDQSFKSEQLDQAISALEGLPIYTRAVAP
jgi:hypothetical protein